jgi:HK97 family phage prohead protease
MPATEERRDLALAAAGLDIRAAADGSGERFVGLASPFNSRAAIGNPKTWGFYEEFAPGCYTDTLSQDDQRFLIDHDSYFVVSRVSAGSLTPSVSARGLEWDSALDDGLSYVGDLKTNVRNKNITGMSIGFMVREGGDQWSVIEVEEPLPDGRVAVYQAELRRVLSVQLFEGSAVTFPAFTDTEASLRFGVMPALLTRGSRTAIETRAAHMPEIGKLLDLLGERREANAPTPGRQPVSQRMDALRARYPRLRG